MKMKPVYETIKYRDPITGEFRERLIARPEVEPDYSGVIKTVKTICVTLAMIVITYGVIQ